MIHHPTNRMLGAALLLALLLSVGPARPARAALASPLTVRGSGAELQLDWGPVAPTTTLAELASGLGWAELGGYRLPARLLTITLATDAALVPTITALETAPWAAPLTAEAAPPAAAAAELTRAAGAPAHASPATLPASPLQLIRDGRAAGERIVVLAFSPVFLANGRPTLATRVSAQISQAPALSGATDAAPANLGPTNLAALGPAARVSVGQGGIQRVDGAALAQAGITLAGLAPGRLRLYRHGRELPLEERGTADGRLDPTDELRFYAPPPGDRWNRASSYWLVVGQPGGLRMGARSVASDAAPLATTAQEAGVWSAPAVYDSALPGADGDHWYSIDLHGGPGLPTATTTIALATLLPLAAGPLRVTLSGVAYTNGAHTLDLLQGGSGQRVQWSGGGPWEQTVLLDRATAALQITLAAAAAPDGVLLDRVRWAAPVQLTLGTRGAIIQGAAALARYQLGGTPSPDRYDIDDPERPVRLVGGTATAFEDSGGPHTYLFGGSETLRTPRLSRHAPTALPSPAEALYLAPQALHAALAPLVAHRQRAGYRVAVVDVQDLYDLWGGGDTDPEAIRGFLRYAWATWPRQPQALALVGDGSADPLNYTGRNSPNLIPPYLAMVDPWIGETACDSCYARLDGADPLADALPELAVGRLPVKSAAELTALAAKLIAYERFDNGVEWRARQIYLADNGFMPNGAPDPAGDFAAAADATIALQPVGVTTTRVYYDPWGYDGAGRRLADAWRTPDAQQAHAQTLAALNQGASLLVYFGHSHQWQWGVTDPTRATNMLLGLYDPDTLSNQGRLPIVLAMTCLSSAFHTPAYNGTTVDERLLLSPSGGAVAVWGSAGLGVSHGHDWLVQGFMAALWQEGSAQPPVGTLMLAGYRELFAHGTCCQDALWSFVLLGDPLTPARALAAQRLALPLLSR